jgi:two-component system nitrogen regulation response regulator GlnG
LQTRLLRVLSDGQYYRVGGHQPIKAHVRVIAATHQNLEERVREGAFREDLFHRLNVIRLRLPPLRERREDIAGLTRHFLARSAKELGVEAKRVSEAALLRVMDFEFPGNVRQLENLCHWLTVMAPAQVVDPKDLPPEIIGTHPQGSSLSATGSPKGAAEISSAMAAPATEGAGTEVGDGWLLDLERQARSLLERGEEQIWDRLARDFEGQLIRTALAMTKGRRIEAAHKLGIGRNTITRKIQDLGLED